MILTQKSIDIRISILNCLLQIKECKGTKLRTLVVENCGIGMVATVFRYVIATMEKEGLVTAEFRKRMYDRFSPVKEKFYSITDKGKLYLENSKENING